MLKSFIFLLSTMWLLISCQKESGTNVISNKEALFEGSCGETGNSAILTSDNQIVICGYDNTTYSTFIYNITPALNLNWSKKYINQNKYFFGKNGICVSNKNDGYILSASTALGYVTNGYDMMLLKLNKSGDTIWSKKYGTFSNYNGTIFTEIHDYGGLIISIPKENAYLAGGSISGFILTKINENGDSLWQKQYSDYPDVSSYNLKHLLLLADGNYLLSGNIIKGFRETYLLKIDTNGNKLWSKSIKGRGNYNKWGSCSIELYNGDIINCNVESEIHITKIDKHGNLIWDNLFDSDGIDPYNGLAVAKNQENNFIVIGCLAGSTDLMMKLFDKDGNQLWSKAISLDFTRFGSFYKLFVKNIICPPKENYSIVVCTLSFQNNIPDKIVVFKIDNEGNVK